MTAPSPLRSDVAKSTQEPEAPADEKIKRPPQGFAEKAIELAATVNKSKKDLMKATGRTGESTWERLQAGRGSMIAAHAVKRTLRSWGADVAQLPPLDDRPSDEPSEMWLKDWIAVGIVLHRYETNEKWQARIDDLRKRADAFELLADDLVEISRPNVSDDKPPKP